MEAVYLIRFKSSVVIRTKLVHLALHLFVDQPRDKHVVLAGFFSFITYIYDSMNLCGVIYNDTLMRYL